MPGAPGVRPNIGASNSGLVTINPVGEAHAEIEQQAVEEVPRLQAAQTGRTEAAKA